MNDLSDLQERVTKLEAHQLRTYAILVAFSVVLILLSVVAVFLSIGVLSG